jgi:phosphate transport system substrate-binding protein
MMKLPVSPSQGALSAWLNGIRASWSFVWSMSDFAASLTIRPRMYAFAVIVYFACAHEAWSDGLILQGSTTFNTTVIVPFGKAVELETGLELNVVPNNSRLGLEALFAGEADLAMVSADLKSEESLLRAANPNLPYGRLQLSEIARSRVAFIIHPSNPVRTLPLDSIRRILTGEMTNWKELGGLDQKILVVTVRPGGGVLATVETRLLGASHITAPDVLRVRVGNQIVTVVEQEPGAIGLSQSSLVQVRNATELTADPPIEQVLSLVSLGAPSKNATAVIEAMRRKFGLNQ